MSRAKKKTQVQDELIDDQQPVEATETVEETVPVETQEDLPITQEDVRLVEAILFASPAPISVSQIAERFPEDRVSLIPDVLVMLQETFAARGVNLVQRDNRWAFRTATDLAESLRIEKEQPKKFTRAAMETMAIVAYHQPVTRAEIENIRGVATSPGALDALMEAGWIKPGKRREVPGRPVTWLSTQAFLDHFGLEKLEDLPGMDELKAAGLLDKRPAIEAMPTTSDLFDGSGEEDPQEVTDEDLIGKSALHGDDEDGESGFEESGDEDEDMDDEDFDDESDDESDDDEDSDDEDSDEDDLDAEDSDSDDEDDDYDDEDEDDEESDDDEEDDED